MKVYVTLMIALFFVADGYAQNPLSNFQKDFFKLKKDTSITILRGKNYFQNSKGGIKILPQDNMPALVSTINSNMPVVTGLGYDKNYKPVPIPNKKFPFLNKIVVPDQNKILPEG